MKKNSILITTTFVLVFFIQMVTATEINAVRYGSRIDVTIDGQIFTSYVFSMDEKFPFFFPVNGPVTGGSVTSMRNSEYPWHCSLFLACDMVNGGNYWYEGFERGQAAGQCRKPQIPQRRKDHTALSCTDSCRRPPNSRYCRTV